MDTGAQHAADDPEGQGDRAAGSARRRSGELSGLVLEVLREAGRPQTPGDVLERLSDNGSGPLAYTTVVTILSRLQAHGLVDRSRAGRAYAYQAADEAQLAARRMRHVLDGEGDRDAVLARFVGDLSDRDEEVLRQLLGPDLSPGPPPGDRRRRDG